MISEILDIIANLGSLPSKENKPKDSKKEILVFICYLIFAICIIFIIPEFKAINKIENSSTFILINVIVSFALTYLTTKILKKLNLIQNINFTNLLILVISIFLIFVLTLFQFNKYFNFINK